MPESLRGQFESGHREHDDECNDECDHSHNGHSHGAADFSINPDIPIPVEIPEGEEQFDLNELSWEMILSGMLHVISLNEEKPEWIDYYRLFTLALRPDIMGEFTEAAILKARNGDFDMALEIMDALRGLFPVSPAVRLNRALVLEERAALFQRQGKQEATDASRAAEAAYNEALDMEPPFPDALFNGGFFFLSQKNFRRARECFSRYIELAEDDDKREQAENTIKEIEESGLEDESFREACEFIQQGDEEAGMQSIRDFLERYPTVWNGWFILGWALRRLGRWDDGAAAFRKAIELGGSSSDTRNELAICLMETEDFSGARKELESALREDPDNIKIISNLGVLALKDGDEAEAAAFFRTVLALDSDDPIAKEFAKPRPAKNPPLS